MIRWASEVLLKWSIKLSRYADKLEGKIDHGFLALDREIDRIKKQIKDQIV